jgi:uncharacterized protein (TIGR02301 family)
MRSFCSILLILLLAAPPAIVAAGKAAAQDAAPEPAPDKAAKPGTPTSAAKEGDAAQEDALVGPPLPVEPPPPIYEDQLLRLSEIMGALSFLRGLCGQPDASAWREEMSALLAAERPGPQRRSRLIGRFNHGYETFNAVYRSCTPSANLAISRYLAEGKALSADVRSRYSQ